MAARMKTAETLNILLLKQINKKSPVLLIRGSKHNMTTKTQPAVKSKLLAKSPKAAEPSKPKILIFGASGVGKTWTSLDFPKCYYIDTEAGADLAHYTDKLEKSGGVYMGPTDGALDFPTVVAQAKALATEDHDYKTLIIDSISKLYLDTAAIAAEKDGDEFGRDKKEANKPMRQLINWLCRLDMNVILIAHERLQWANGEQTGVTFDCWSKLEYELHLCLNIQKRGDQRSAFVRKSRLLGFPNSTSFPWTYEEFAKRYGKDVIESKSKQITLASEVDVLEVKRLLENVRVSEDDIAKWMTKAGVTSWDEMTAEQIQKVLTFLKGKLAS